MKFKQFILSLKLLLSVGNRGWLRAWRNHGHLLLC